MFVETKKEGEVPTKLEPWRQLLLDAAGVMEKRGKCIGTYTNDAGQLCFYGSLNVAAGIAASEEITGGVCHQAIIKMCKFTGVSALGCDFSDRNTVKTVITAMRACARSDAS